MILLETIVLIVVADILRNGDLYRSTDIRPAYTYASLIRQVALRGVSLYSNGPYLTGES